MSTKKHTFGKLNHAKVPQALCLILIIFLAAACAVQSTRPADIIKKTVTLQYNPTGAKLESIEVAKAVFTTKGWIEAQLPVTVQVLDPSLNVDLTRACELRFVDSTTLLSLALDSDFRNKGLSRHNGPRVYPCQILLRDTLTDLADIQLILQHELGHIILDQPGHSNDPHSIMSNGVSLPGRYRFTERDAARLQKSQK